MHVGHTDMLRHISPILLLLSVAALGWSSTVAAAESRFSWPGWKIPARTLQERGALAIVEDEEALSKRPVAGGKDGKEKETPSALQQRVSRRAIAKSALAVARTPLLRWAAIEPGVYRVSARIKFDGDTGVIGTPIRLSVNLHPGGAGASRDFSATDLAEPGKYQAISFYYEVSPTGDKRLAPRQARHPWGAYAWVDEVYPNSEPVKKAKARKPDARPEGLMIALSLPKTKYSSMTGMPPNSLRWVRLDSIRLEKIQPSPSITVRAVRPRKLWLRPGQDSGFDVYLENFTGARHQRTLALILEHGLNERRTIHSADVELPAGQAKTVFVPWKTTKDTPLFGYKVIAEIRRGNQSEAAAHDYFQVHPRNYDVHIMGSRTRTMDPFRHPERHQNHVEVFAATPGDMARILPTDNAWISGMSGGNVVYTYKTVRASTDHNAKHGIQTAMYLFAGGTGTPTMDLHVAHPEWVAGKVVSTDQTYAAMRTRENAVKAWDWEKQGLIPAVEGGCPTLEQHLNHRHPALQKQVERELVEFIVKSGYGAVRFDVGILAPRAGSRTVLGTEHAVKINDPMAHAARNFNSLRAAVEAKFPHFEWGANMDTYAYLDTIKERDAPIKAAETYPEFIAFCQAHGMFMDEGTMGAPLYDDYMNRWEDAWYFMNLKRAIARKHGGGVYQLFSPHRDGAGHFCHDDIYFTMMSIASGSHYVGAYAPPPYSEESMGAFATRFSEFFWSDKLRPIEAAEEVIFVDAPADLWYAEGATQEDLPGKRRYVVPLLNPPVAERLRRNKSNELPPPIEESFDIEVAMPEGFAKAEAWMLSWEPRVHSKRVKSKVEGETLRVRFPPLKLFSVLVVEFAK